MQHQTIIAIAKIAKLHLLFFFILFVCDTKQCHHRGGGREKKSSLAVLHSLLLSPRRGNVLLASALPVAPGRFAKRHELFFLKQGSTMRNYTTAKSRPLPFGEALVASGTYNLEPKQDCWSSSRLMMNLSRKNNSMHCTWSTR